MQLDKNSLQNLVYERYSRNWILMSFDLNLSVHLQIFSQILILARR